MDWKGFEVLRSGVEKRISEFARIPEIRRKELEQLALGIRTGLKKNQTLDVVFICTHNSRRSQMGQIWAQLASRVYGVENIHCYSGGTEATAFHQRAVNVMKEEGFRFRTVMPGSNPVYAIQFPGARETDRYFSKKVTDPPNPTKGFIAVMTCADADEACPVVHGADVRYAIRYDDPKAFDGTPAEKEGYTQRSRQIAREMFFLFSRVASTI
ncbi:MAG: protein-tyrosine-phosphatase [Bacteroidota bacterium]